MAPPKLYTIKDSGNCYKPRLLAALLNIKLELVEVDYRNDQHHSPEFLAINPRGQIPALVDGDKVFTDSAAILVYLSGYQSDSNTIGALLPFWSNDVVEQAEIVDWVAFATGWIQSGIATARAIIRFRGVSATTQPLLDTATAKGEKSLEILQLRLRTNEWLAVGRPTIADIAVFCYVVLAPQGNISLDPYPAVKSWISRIRNLPGFFAIEGLDDPEYGKRA
ncbi:thioredoxin-like protein [Viridothelium virens]|uniref:Thioredoxin-like protein n=1 Tax=Viridothelium virens TaxID=1048519 RepID=A0A6A6H3W7_VIRVR|nr:thioredoxin-like protein [Viridothelium virens]